MNIEKIKIQNKISELQNKLLATDYQAIKFAEGELSAEEFEPIREQRRTWRVEINELETELKSITNDIMIL